MKSNPVGVNHPQCYTVTRDLKGVVDQGTLDKVPEGQVEVEIHQEEVNPLNVVHVQGTLDTVPVVESVSLD